MVEQQNKGKMVICLCCGHKFWQSDLSLLEDCLMYQNSDPYCSIKCRNTIEEDRKRGVSIEELIED